MMQQLDLIDWLAGQDPATGPADAETAVLLQRIDPARNMARYYAFTVERTLFGEYALVRRWGRIGSRGSGQMQSTVFAYEGDATLALDRQRRAKVRRGYAA
ncbi:WGR domain-containing protein [Aurantimonas sp. VKM B-3413]|uniref:WGR domain-containing protein n=1 Tax=Aurantimonas sp. VKM B-3413 TaxID=2779401 RepID=UPI001E479E96|nr:WGR domain-containing protein [Aurantimonas sp. VKM B-3413]MCB8835845.1 WGR domain-containing protein [Aurantimonas sp. VKM B-3413]